MVLIKKDADLWKIDKDLIKRVSDNSKLKLTKEELDKFSKQLDDILSTFHELDKVDTENVKPSFHPQEIKNIWREDEAVECKIDFLENVKNKEDRYFKGPRIV